MGKKTVICSFILFAGISYNAHSQDQPQKNARKFNHFLEIGLGLTYHGIRDEATSPLTYKGFQPAFHLEYLISNQNFQGMIDENFSLGYLKTRNFNSKDDNRANTYNNELSFSGLFKFRDFAKSDIYFGGELATLTNIRQNEKFNNANINYEAIVSLAPMAMFEYRTSWNAGRHNLGLFSLKKRDRDFRMQYMLSMPVLTGILRPGFVTISDFVDNTSLFVEADDIHIVSFNHFLYLKNRFNFYYILHNNNMLKFNYNLSYFSYYKKLNPVKGFSSAFFVSIVFRFTNNT